MVTLFDNKYAFYFNHISIYVEKFGNPSIVGQRDNETNLYYSSYTVFHHREFVEPFNIELKANYRISAMYGSVNLRGDVIPNWCVARDNRQFKCEFCSTAEWQNANCKDTPIGGIKCIC